MVTHDGIRPVSAEGTRRAMGAEAACTDSKSGRFAAQRKAEVVLRLLRGEDMDLLSRELQIPAARLAAWRDAFLAGGQEAMKKHPRDARECEIARLREKLGESTMANELLREKIARLETGRPLRLRRSSR
jgi:transposase-like protein